MVDCTKSLWEKYHEYGQWQTKSEGEIKKGAKVIGHAIVQERTCKNCDFVELNQQKRTIYDQ